MIKPEIGENAGKLWVILERTSEMPVNQLHKQTGLTEADFNMALGWLARELKVHFFKKKDVLHICLIFL